MEGGGHRHVAVMWVVAEAHPCQPITWLCFPLFFYHPLRQTRVVNNSQSLSPHMFLMLSATSSLVTVFSPSISSDSPFLRILLSSPPRRRCVPIAPCSEEPGSSTSKNINNTGSQLILSKGTSFQSQP